MVAMVHGDLHTPSAMSKLKEVADCTFSLLHQHTCKILLKHQSGKPVVAVCAVLSATINVKFCKQVYDCC